MAATSHMVCCILIPARASCRHVLEVTGNCCVVQLCQMAQDNPDIVVLKIDFDENRDVVKPLAIKVRHSALLAPLVLH